MKRVGDNDILRPYKNKRGRRRPGDAKKPRPPATQNKKRMKKKVPHTNDHHYKMVVKMQIFIILLEECRKRKKRSRKFLKEQPLYLPSCDMLCRNDTFLSGSKKIFNE